MRCGTIAILGRPNAGKSTLLNALVGTKIVGISRKPETTRHQILGVHTLNEAQLIFLDTPGLLTGQASSLVSRHGQNHAERAASEADLTVYLVDSSEINLSRESDPMAKVVAKKRSSSGFLVALSKVDRLKKAEILCRKELLTTWLASPERSQLKSALTTDPLTISAKNKTHITQLREHLATYLPERHFMFPPQTLTNRSDEFVVAEMIREQIFRRTSEEIPYHTYVTATIKTGNKDKLKVHATIHVTKKSHKGMMIGKNGQALRAIREQSEVTLKQYFGRHIHLHLWVKVATNWHKSQREVEQMIQ